MPLHGEANCFAIWQRGKEFSTLQIVKSRSCTQVCGASRLPRPINRCKQAGTSEIFQIPVGEGWLLVGTNIFVLSKLFAKLLLVVLLCFKAFSNAGRSRASSSAMCYLPSAMRDWSVVSNRASLGPFLEVVEHHFDGVVRGAVLVRYFLTSRCRKVGFEGASGIHDQLFSNGMTMRSLGEW